MRNKGTAAELEVRRRVAASPFGQKITLAEIAQLLDVSLSSVKRWKKAFQHQRPVRLAAKKHPGPRCRLSEDQQEQLCELLVTGAQASGYASDLWTCRRVAELIERQLGFSPQKPLRRARERDEEAIERWRQQAWPRIKKRDAACKLALSFSTKAGSSCSP